MSRLEWILGIVLVVLLLAPAGLAVSLWIKPDTTAQPVYANDVMAAYADDVAPLPQTAVQTAKRAFVIAQPKAQAWQPDAALVSASATWPQGAQSEFIEQGTADWAFTFHSPATQSNAVVVITNGQPVLIPGESQNAVKLLQSSSWQLDSPEAAAKFLGEGGKSFIDVEGITILSMTFAANNPGENGRLEWLISAFATQTGHSYTMRVDAATGEILEIINASS
ncbi:MAG: hypothetical protein R6X34_30695 [Chloroflexota bacterium]